MNVDDHFREFVADLAEVLARIEFLSLEWRGFDSGFFSAALVAANHPNAANGCSY